MGKTATLGKFNFRTPRFLEANFVRFFAVFSKATWSSEMCFTSLESPNIWLL